MEKKAWERLDNEPSAMFHYFCIYRDLGIERTMDKAVKRIHDTEGKVISKRALQSQSSKHDWVKRAALYDDYLDEKNREINEKLIGEMARRHASESKELQRRIYELKDHVDIVEGHIPLTKVVWVFQTLVGAYEKMALLERLSRGEPTENVYKNDDGLKALARALKDNELGLDDDEEEE